MKKWTEHEFLRRNNSIPSHRTKYSQYATVTSPHARTQHVHPPTLPEEKELRKVGSTNLTREMLLEKSQLRKLEMTLEATTSDKTTLKTEALTLTTQLADIMITDNKIEIAKKIYEQNDVFNVSSKPARVRTALSAALVEYRSTNLLNCHASAMDQLYHQVISYLPEYTCWLLLSNGGMVKSSRIVEYYRLWDGLDKGGITLPLGQRTKEYSLKNGNEIQYFGATQLKNPNFFHIAKLISTHASTHLTLSKSNSVVEKILGDGWSYGSTKHPDKILYHLENESVFLITPIGEFDDTEGGAVTIARSELIQKCYGIRPT